MNNSARIKQYIKVSTSLACFSNAQLNQILVDAKPMHEGIGGKSCLCYIDETPVFVKKVPLTDFEQLPQNFMSTANLFNLPLRRPSKTGGSIIENIINQAINWAINPDSSPWLM